MPGAVVLNAATVRTTAGTPFAPSAIRVMLTKGVKVTVRPAVPRRVDVMLTIQVEAGEQAAPKPLCAFTSMAAGVERSPGKMRKVVGVAVVVTVTNGGGVLLSKLPV